MLNKDGDTKYSSNGATEMGLEKNLEYRGDEIEPLEPFHLSEGLYSYPL